MRKALLSILISSLLLTACNTTDSEKNSVNNEEKWQVEIQNLTEEYVSEQQTIIDENLEILKEDSKSLEANLEIAFRYQLLGDLKNSEIFYKKALNIKPKHEKALNNIAALYEQVEEYDLAATYIKKLYELLPNRREVINDTVRIHLKAKDDINAQLALDNYASLVDRSNPDVQKLINNIQETISSYREKNVQ